MNASFTATTAAVHIVSIYNGKCLQADFSGAQAMSQFKCSRSEPKQQWLVDDNVHSAEGGAIRVAAERGSSPMCLTAGDPKAPPPHAQQL